MGRTANDDRVLTRHETASLTGISLATLDREIKRRRFPAPIKPSARRVGWLASTVPAWLKTRPKQ
jgi:prophage regulatory protein